MEKAQIPQQANYFIEIHHHPPYNIPPFQVAGLAPGPAREENGPDSNWAFGLGPEKKRIKEVEFLQARPVSTGLGLSLDTLRPDSSGFVGLLGDEFERELQRQDEEIDRYLQLQGDRLRQAILEKFHASQMQTISYIEERVVQKLREKEAEVEDINKKNTQLELQMQQLTLEANAWEHRAKYYENLINTLQFNLQQVYAQSRDSKEGCGDSEVNDTASCYNGRSVDLHLNCRDVNESGEAMICKVCRVNGVRMLLLPCKHLCLCKDCESKLSLCPLCHTSKYVGMEVYR